MPPEAAELARQIYGQRYEAIKQYVDILISRGIAEGLLGPKEADRVWERHVLNSISIASLIPRGTTVADVGSGAGLPGLPLAILRDDLTVTLIESMLRRTSFLKSTVAELGLNSRVRVVRARIEDVREKFDVVTGRAVAPLAKFVQWTAPLVGDSGDILALKGESVQAELDDAVIVLRRLSLVADVLEVRADPQAEPTRVVRARRQ